MREMGYGGVDKARHFQIEIETKKVGHGHRADQQRVKRVSAKRQSYFSRGGWRVGTRWA